MVSRLLCASQCGMINTIITVSSGYSIASELGSAIPIFAPLPALFVYPELNFKIVIFICHHFVLNSVMTPRSFTTKP